MLSVASSARTLRRSLLVAAVWLCSTPAIASATSTTPVAKIWVEPDAGYGFMDRAIAGAQHEVDLSLYELRDPTIVALLERRAASGVTVRVLLNAAYDGRSENTAAAAELGAHRVHVAWAPSGQIFHAKYAIIDGRVYLGTGNLAAQDYATSRDFWVELVGRAQTAAVTATFRQDFAGSGANPVAAPGLVWSPGSTSALTGLIASAQRSLLVENEEMEDPAIVDALSAAARRGVHVTVVMTASSSWAAALTALANAGVAVRLHHGNAGYIHAKVICADCAGGAGTAFLGSENFSASSLERNREAGIETTDPPVVATIATTVRADAATGTALTGTTPSGGSSAPSAGGSVRGLTVTAFTRSTARGAEDQLSVRTRSGASCSLGVTLPSGYESASSGLGTTIANASGVASWTWKIGSRTSPGTATATVRCGSATWSGAFAITA